MNKETEMSFLSDYIVSSRRERLAFELFGQKRRDGIGRFCHNADELIRKTTVIRAGADISPQELAEYIAASGEKSCYLISFYEDIDGTIVHASDVTDIIIGRGMPSIAVFGSFAVIETEQYKGPAVKYILRRI